MSRRGEIVVQLERRRALAYQQQAVWMAQCGRFSHVAFQHLLSAYVDTFREALRLERPEIEFNINSFSAPRVRHAIAHAQDEVENSAEPSPELLAVLISLPSVLQVWFDAHDSYWIDHVSEEAMLEFCREVWDQRMPEWLLRLQAWAALDTR